MLLNNGDSTVMQYIGWDVYTCRLGIESPPVQTDLNCCWCHSTQCSKPPLSSLVSPQGSSINCSIHFSIYSFPVGIKGYTSLFMTIGLLSHGQASSFLAHFAEPDILLLPDPPFGTRLIFLQVPLVECSATFSIQSSPACIEEKPCHLYVHSRFF